MKGGIRLEDAKFVGECFLGDFLGVACTESMLRYVMGRNGMEVLQKGEVGMMTSKNK